MELGMVGLGRMGANMARRLMRDGHRMRRLRRQPRRGRRRWPARAPRAPPRWRTWPSKLSAPRSVWVMVPAGEITEKTVDDVAAVLESGDAIIDGGNSYYRDDIRRAAKVRRAGDRLRRLRHQRRRLRPRARLLPDDRRPRRGGRAARPDLRHAGAGRRVGRAHAGPRRRRLARRERLPALRPERRRPLREDGPQRDRVRDHGRLRRGPQHPQERQRRQGRSARPTPRRRRSSIPSTTSTTSTCPRSPRSGGAAA